MSESNTEKVPGKPLEACSKPVPGTATILARVAWPSICHDGTCSFSSEHSIRHLVVNFTEVPLNRSNATAISYVWGQFRRKEPIPIGHHAGRSQKIISVKLGSEWVIEDFIACLAETAEKDAKPIWIDQLCIEQNDQAIRKVLADIPSIYRSFDVTVLMPGRPCRCLPRIVREVNGLPPDPEDPYRISRTDECLNATGISSWFRRLWPRQELHYSRRIRCVWSARERSRCFLVGDGTANLQNLGPFAARLYSQFTTVKGFNHQDALEEILIYFDDLEKEGRSDLVRYAHNPNHTDPLYRFLDGETLENQAQGLEKKNVYAFVLHVLEEYGSAYLWTPNRQASKPRDYVVSIWTDWDKYVIPHNYNTMEASSLMQDAIDQMFDKEGLVFGSTAPQGLFSGDLAGSAIWKPSEYLTKVESSGVVDYYRTIAAEIHVIPVLRDKSVPLVRNRTNLEAVPLSIGAKDGHALIDELLGRHAETALQASGRINRSELSPGDDTSQEASVISAFTRMFHGLVDNWSEDRVSRVNQRLFSWDFNIGDGRAIEEMWTILLDLFNRHDEDLQYSATQQPEGNGEPSQSKMEKLHSTMGLLVCLALGIDYGYFRDGQVKLIFSASEHPSGRTKRVGLCRRDVDVLKIASGKTDVLTVKMFSGEHPPMLFEVERVGSRSNTPEYRVFGVWVPLEFEANDMKDFGMAVLHPSENREKYDAVLV